MKHLIALSVFLMLAPAVFAEAIRAKVSLSATPANEVTFGTAVGLVAKVVELKPVPQLLHGFEAHLRYTFTAQRNWPCAEAAVTIAQNSQQYAQTWHPAKTGEYVVTVRVTYIEPLAKPSRFPEVVGTATLNYKVKPQGLAHNIIWSYNPPSGSNAPIVLKVTTTLSQPPDPSIPSRFRFTAYCTGGCQPATATSDGQLPYYTFTTNVNSAATLSFTMYVDEVHISDCQWIGSGWDHQFNYIVKPPAAP